MSTLDRLSDELQRATGRRTEELQARMMRVSEETARRRGAIVVRPSWRIRKVEGMWQVIAIRSGVVFRTFRTHRKAITWATDLRTGR